MSELNSLSLQLIKDVYSALDDNLGVDQATGLAIRGSVVSRLADIAEFQSGQQKHHLDTVDPLIQARDIFRGFVEEPNQPHFFATRVRLINFALGKEPSKSQLALRGRA